MTARPRATTLVAIIVAAAAAAAVGGCATLPPTGVGATGQPLGLIVESQHYTVAQNQLVGQVQYHDANGRAAGSANVYQTQMVHRTNVEWQSTQGGTAIDEEDFLRISGDIETARALHDIRANGVTLNRVGWVIMAASVAGFVAARMATDGRRWDVPAYLGFIGGTSFCGYGNKKAQTQHIIELDQARTLTARYNDSLAPPSPPKPTP